MDSRGNGDGDSSSDGDEDDVESAAEVAALAAGMIEAAEETLKDDGDGPALAGDGEDAEAGAKPSSGGESLWEPMVRHYIHMNLKVRGSCAFSRVDFCGKLKCFQSSFGEAAVEGQERCQRQSRRWR